MLSLHVLPHARPERSCAIDGAASALSWPAAAVSGIAQGRTAYLDQLGVKLLETMPPELHEWTTQNVDVFDEATYRRHPLFNCAEASDSVSNSLCLAMSPAAAFLGSPLFPCLIYTCSNHIVCTARARMRLTSCRSMLSSNRATRALA